MEVRVEAKRYVEVLEQWEATLNNYDDPNFWRTALSILMTDAAYDIGDYSGGQNIYLEVGSCSHWLRPHQTRWTADGGFAWPSGYGSTSFSRRGLPEFDWSTFFLWKKEEKTWALVAPRSVWHKRRFILRLALPSRTARHNQAVVHTIWTPGQPQEPNKNRARFYGFRKSDEEWQLVAWHDEQGNCWR